MTEGILAAERPDELARLARRVRDRALRRPVTPLQVMEVLERWGQALHGAAFDAVPGLAFLRLWLRRGTLEPIVERELGREALQGAWRGDGLARLGVFPRGVVGHWPAANIEIQPLLSMSCALLGGNACLVRVPTGLVESTRTIIERLFEVDAAGVLAERVSMASFAHERHDLQRAMAAAVDGAMIWGGAEAVSQLRALPFPPWARVEVFGPRMSVAAMDADTWSDKSAQAAWCQRIARDVWQFDQQACSSPQVLFLERRDGAGAEAFVAALRRAFDEENRLHPRRDIEASLSAAICLARASWMLAQGPRDAVFPASPDWTLLLGTGADLPEPIQGRTLYILLVDDLMEPVSRFDGTVQTLGLAVRRAEREAVLAEAAAHRGVDRIVKLGRMHVFGSPWDGTDLVRPMTRIVRHLPSQAA